MHARTLSRTECDRTVEGTHMTDRMAREAMSVARQLAASTKDEDIESPRTVNDLFGALEAWLSAEDVDVTDDDQVSADDGFSFYFSGRFFEARVTSSINFSDYSYLHIDHYISIIPANQTARALVLLNEIAGGSIGSYGVVAFEDTDTSLVVHTISIIGEPKNMQLAIGADETHTSPALIDQVRASFSHLQAGVNESFHGTYVPLRFYDAKDARVQSVMLEIRRDTYMNEETVQVLPSGYSASASSLQSLVTSLNEA